MDKRHKWKRRAFILAGIALLVLLLFACRFPILRGFGNFLICENTLQKSDAIFVLSGAPGERGQEAAKVLNAGYANVAYCTGESVPQDLYSLGITLSECDITRSNMIRSGADSLKVRTIKYGTSTQEESDTILNFCKKHRFKQVILISSKFHTRRVGQAFREKLESKGVKVIIHGASSGAYNERKWWQNEHGLIALNNEYIKLIYYWLKY
ncbi:MAG: ElyC/SanA/YdcF family protein [Chitinophagales bacterium]|nr:ElyC/SanA/YdcF family protein [Chitinophagales bacterium]